MTRRSSTALRLAVATTASAAALIALAAPSSATLSAPAGKTVTTTNDYATASCKLVLSGTDGAGNEAGYVATQAQGTLLGLGKVKSTAVTCTVLTPAGPNSFTAAASGPSVPSSRKNVTLAPAGAYTVCTTLTEFLYNNGTAIRQSNCG